MKKQCTHKLCYNQNVQKCNSTHTHTQTQFGRQNSLSKFMHFSGESSPQLLSTDNIQLPPSPHGFAWPQNLKPFMWSQTTSLKTNPIRRQISSTHLTSFNLETITLVQVKMKGKGYTFFRMSQTRLNSEEVWCCRLALAWKIREREETTTTLPSSS